jgi:Protein of unknown function (DUF3616)
MIDHVDSIRRIGGAGVLWFGMLFLSLSGLVAGAQAQESASPITTREINLDQLVAAGRVQAAMCEPSAAVRAPWDPELVLVGDNEVREQLYAFSITAEGLNFVEALDIPKEGGKRPRDVEALAAIGGSVMIVGSHGRNSRCQARDNRQRLELVRRGSDGGLAAEDFIDSRAELAAAMTSEERCLATLFVAPAPPPADAVCKALVGANQAADAGAPPSACTALNIEGAVGLPDGRVWLGLRSPLVDRQAIMLRLTPDHDEFRFDRAVLVDLGNRGIRELSYDRARQQVWGLAGPDIDRADPFRLWHVPAGDLADHSHLVGTKDDRELPTSSEGLVILEDHAVLLVDGAAAAGGEAGKTCEIHAREYELALTP